MRTVTIILADGSIRTATTRAVTLRGVLNALGVRVTDGMFHNSHVEVWDAETSELVGLLDDPNA